MAKPKEGYHDMFAQIPEGLWQALADDAERNQRSATGHLIWLLRQQYPNAVIQSSPPPAADEPAAKKRGKKK
jgi:hypothetical protein